MKKVLLTVCSGVVIALAWIAQSCNSDGPVQAAAATEKKSPTETDMMARGSHLVTTIGCNHCHSPKKMGPHGPEIDSARLLSGHPADAPMPPIDKNALKPGNWILFAGDLTATVGPWGISYAANLTPDSATGLGMWSEADFVKTMRTGKHLGQEGGRPIMPPMPWESIGQLSDDDLKALYSFLHSIPAVKNKVPAYGSPDQVAQLK